MKYSDLNICICILREIEGICIKKFIIYLEFYLKWLNWVDNFFTKIL